MNASLLKNTYVAILNPNGHDGFCQCLAIADEAATFMPADVPGRQQFFIIPYAENFYQNRVIVFEPKTFKPNLTSFDLDPGTTEMPLIRLKPRLEKNIYIQKINALKHHIQVGDIYEINFCMDFFAEDITIDPLLVYRRLNALSEAPFSAFIKLKDTYIICSSPERFLKKEGRRLFTQPIKGTARRGADTAEDLQLKRDLAQSLKEQTENVMIVDVARNDLSKVAARGSVQVDKLFGIYSYKQVHQMVSTVSCELKKEVDLHDILNATFPMPSMTGAPKQRAAELIGQYEAVERGFYSGCIGYMDEHGDFDLNVVIRSIVYDAATKKISFHVGSAITAMCDAEAEYDECMVKAGAMLKALNAVIGGD